MAYGLGSNNNNKHACDAILLYLIIRLRLRARAQSSVWPFLECMGTTRGVSARAPLRVTRTFLRRGDIMSAPTA